MPRSLAPCLVFLTLLATALVAAPARACRCVHAPVATAREDAAALFEGRVLQIARESADARAIGGELRVTLAVVRTWKDLEREERVDVYTNGSSATCGYTFAKATSYLVYADRHDGRLYVSACSRTRVIAEAAEDLKALGAGSTPVRVEPKSAAGEAEKPDAASAARAGSAPARAHKAGGCASGNPRAELSAAWCALPALGLALRRLRRS